MKEETKKSIGVVVMIFILGFVAYWVYIFFSHTSFLIFNGQLNEVCTNYGYEEATDSRFVYPRDKWGDERLILIECDGEVIKNRNGKSFYDDKWFEMKVIGSSWCAKRDKWGDCVYHNNNKTTTILH